MIDDSYLLADTISHIGQRRRERKKGISVSGIPCKNHSGLNLIFNRPKRNRKCPICGAKLFLVSEVDEFEIAPHQSWRNRKFIYRRKVMLNLIVRLGCMYQAANYMH